MSEFSQILFLPFSMYVCVCIMKFIHVDIFFYINI